MYRKKMSMAASNKQFKRKAKRTRAINLGRTVMRGGIRL